MGDNTYANADGRFFRSAAESQLKHYSGCSWFHGNISRTCAEQLVDENGKFLVRESSSLTSYVVTCKWNGKHLHVLVKEGRNNGSPTYGFESIQFPSLPELINYYKVNQLPVTRSSGAVLYNEVSVIKSHDYYNLASRKISATKAREAGSRFNAKVDKLLQHVKQPCMSKWVSAPLLSPSVSDVSQNMKPASSCEDLLDENSHQRRRAPHKPARRQNVAEFTKTKPVIEIRNQQLYEDDGKDYTDYAQLSAIPFFVKVEKLEAESKSTGDSYLDMSGKDGVRPDEGVSSLQQWRTLSSRQFLHLEQHSFRSLPSFEKPLEADKLPRVVDMLLLSDANRVACHLFHFDVKLLLLTTDEDFPPGITCFCDLLEVPCAVNLRLALRDRHESLRYFVIATIVTFDNLKKRKSVLKFWIEVAQYLFDKFLDFFALDTIISALFSEQVQSLSSTLNSFYNDANFGEALNSYRELSSRWRQCPSVCPPGVLVPSLHSRVILSDATVEELFNQSQWPWDWRAVSELLEPPEMVSMVTAGRRAQELLDAHVLDESLLELSLTESLMKILWGPRGALLPRSARNIKMNAILAKFACKVELDVL